MSEGKLKEEVLRLYQDRTLCKTNVNNILDEAKKDILRKIKEYEDEDIPDDVMKAKIIEWFGSDEDD
jgi:hypothetical protein